MGPRRWEAPPEASGGEASPSEAATSEGRPGGREEPGEREDRGAPFPRRTLEGAESGLIPRQTGDISQLFRGEGGVTVYSSYSREVHTGKPGFTACSISNVHMDQ